MYHGNNQERQCKSTGHQRQPSSQPSSPVEAQTPKDPSSTAATAAAAATSCTTTTATTTTTTSMSERRSAGNPALASKLEQMALPLAPLVQMTTGRVHPAFPGTLLHFWLLTDAQLESLAHFYHQRTPSVWTCQYPCPVRWGPHLTLEEKRRKMGMFIGLRGCESPVVVRSAEDLLDEARRHAAVEDDAEDALRRKFGFYQ